MKGWCSKLSFGRRNCDDDGDFALSSIYIYRIIWRIKPYFFKEPPFLQHLVLNRVFKMLGDDGL
jgi:hypothetical protein